MFTYSDNIFPAKITFGKMFMQMSETCEQCKNLVHIMKDNLTRIKGLFQLMDVSHMCFFVLVIILRIKLNGKIIYPLGREEGLINI